ncbi:MAG: acetoacetate decarboxylase family protein [bacterium]
MKGELFRGVMQWEFDWKGTKAKLPVFYYDNTTLTAIYTASTAAVRKLLPLKDMQPIEMFPGRCLAAFTAFEYRKTDIDPYNEFSISFLVSIDARPIPGVTGAIQFAQRRFTTYIWQLPVTTEIARVGGVDLYGYPKFIADITFERQKNWIECKLSENGQKILTLRGNVLQTAKGKTTRYVTYSVKDGVPLVANVYMNPLEFAQSPIGSAAELDIGKDHPIGRALSEIELSKSPVLYQYSPVNEAILFAGRNLIDD